MGRRYPSRRVVMPMASAHSTRAVRCGWRAGSDCSASCMAAAEQGGCRLEIAGRGPGPRRPHPGREGVRVRGPEGPRTLRHHMAGQFDGVVHVAGEPIGHGERVEGGEGAWVLVAEHAPAIRGVLGDQLDALPPAAGRHAGDPEVAGDGQRGVVVVAEERAAPAQRVLEQVRRFLRVAGREEGRGAGVAGGEVVDATPRRRPRTVHRGLTIRLPGPPGHSYPPIEDRAGTLRDDHSPDRGKST